MKNNIKIMLIFCFLFIFISCKNTNKDVESGFKNNAYLPLEIGNVFIYDFYKIDVAGNKIPGTTTLVETKIKDTVSVNNRKGFIFELNDTSNTYHSIEKYTTSKNNIYFHSDMINGIINSIKKLKGRNIPLKINDQWVKIADFNDEEWNIISKDIEKGNRLFSLIGKQKLYCEKGKSKSFNINNKNVTAEEFILYFDFNGKISPNKSKKSYPVDFSIPTKYYYAKGIGEVFVKAVKKKIDFNFFEVTVGGYEFKLVDYNVN